MFGNVQRQSSWSCFGFIKLEHRGRLPRLRLMIVKFTSFDGPEFVDVVLAVGTLAAM